MFAKTADLTQTPVTERETQSTVIIALSIKDTVNSAYCKFDCQSNYANPDFTWTNRKNGKGLAVFMNTRPSGILIKIFFLSTFIDWYKGVNYYCSAKTDFDL